jgi:alkanesulfonate monooxygenase SsuD/methylene tetrahydromethanopterin reductase-like flavin-dependent oxidoreductase (luciferase family)
MHAMTSIRQPVGTAFAVRDPWPWTEFAGLAQGGEAQGYRAIFLPEIQGRDAFASLTALAAETSTLLLGTGIVRMDARSPQLTAMSAATLQERSAGRGIIGIGTGPAVAGALDRLRALVLAVRAALRGEPAAVDGSPIELSFTPDPPPFIWISALGPRAVEVAGEVADGVLLNWCPPERVARVREQLARGAERAGRDPADITVAGYIRASLGDDQRAALAALKTAAGEYASYPAYARQFDQVGLGEEARAAARAYRAGRPEAVPEALIDAVTLCGDLTVARSRLRAYREAGLDLAVVYPVPAGPDPLASVRTTLAALAPAQGPSPE